MKCFYHKSDLDGHCSGAIIRNLYPECEMIGVDYGSVLDLDSIKINEDIFVVDFSFSVGEMCALNAKSWLIWIDHHKSAIEKMKGYSVTGLCEIGKAGCELTWNYLYPEKTIPMAVHLLGRYDVWDHADERVLQFQYGVRDQDNTFPDSDFWPLVFQSRGYVSEIIDHGKIILSYQSKQDAIYAKGMAYEAEFNGYRAIVINKPFSNSKVFDSIYDQDSHDIMIIFGIKDGSFKYSLFCSKPEIDVSEIAIKYGGGGHKGAAGFYSNIAVV